MGDGDRTVLEILSVDDDQIAAQLIEAIDKQDEVAVAFRRIR